MPNPGWFYGYGWVVESLPDEKRLIWHNGSINGFSSDIARYIDDHLVIIILANLQGIEATRIRRTIADLVLLHLIE